MIDYRILPEHSLIVLCNWGVTPVEEVLTLSQKLRTDPDYSNSYDTIVDNTHQERQYTGEEMRRLSKRRFDPGPSPIKIATIAPSDVTFGMCRMYQIITDAEGHIEAGVFRDAGSALKWLGREGIDVESVFEEIRGVIK